MVRVQNVDYCELCKYRDLDVNEEPCKTCSSHESAIEEEEQ